jgi:hypothetical protein
VALAVVLAVAVPLFLRMPLWCDATLYDVAARNILSGGVHYRDVFDTNPPGFVWLVCGIRAAFGWSWEALRAADLVVVGAGVVLLLRWAKLAGADSACVAWTAVAIAGFYLYTSEFSHVQRDVWMMLPAAAAVLIRLRRIERMRTEVVSGARVFRGAVLEAAVWGLGLWLKPHLALVAGPVWLASAARLAASGGHRARRLASDVLGQLVGLGLVAAAGVCWLVASGAWPHYLDVNRNWNSGYWEVIRAEQSDRDEFLFGYFPPWTDCLRLALPLAALNLLDGVLPWKRAADPRRFARSLLGVALLSWFAIGLYLQRPFMYVHVPEVFLMLALFAANRWAVAFWLIAVRVAAGLFLIYAPGDPDLWAWHGRTYHESEEYRHLMNPSAAFDRDRNRLWPHCFDRHPSRELRLGVALDAQQLGGIDSVQLGEVEDFLRKGQLRDGELLCWHDATHSLYLTLKVRPPVRFMHVGTAMGMGRRQQEQVAEETRRAIPGVRFVVSDLHRLTWNRAALLELDETGLPWFIPDWQRAQFPLDQPVVFRSTGGRYLVHRVVNPVRECVIPGLDQLDPPEGWRPPPGWDRPRSWKGGWRDGE